MVLFLCLASILILYWLVGSDEGIFPVVKKPISKWTPLFFSKGHHGDVPQRRETTLMVKSWYLKVSGNQSRHLGCWVEDLLHSMEWTHLT